MYDSTRILLEVRGQLENHVPGRPERSAAGHGAMAFLAPGEFSWVIVRRGQKVARGRIAPGWVYDFYLAEDWLRLAYVPPPIHRHFRGGDTQLDVLPRSTLTLATHDAEGFAAMASRVRQECRVRHA